MANRISVIVDATVDKATSALKGFRQSVADADGVTNKFKAGSAAAFDALKQNAVLGAAAAGTALVAFATKAIGAASDLDESVNAVNVTFGKAAAGILALGEQSAESVGLSNAAFNGLAVQFSSFVETVVGEGGDVVGTMDDLTHRVADFASVMNLDVPEAAAIFRSALAGESEPIRKFGKNISAAAVEQFALANGLIKTKSEMTEAIKVQARYGLLMEQTADVQDDFANTSDGLANQQRILAAKTEDTAAAYGKALKPALEAILPVLEKGVDAAADLAPAFEAASEKIGEIVADARPLISALELIASGADTAADGFGELDEKTGGWLSKIGGKVFKDAVTKGVFGPIIGGAMELKGAFDSLTGSTDKQTISLDHLDERSYAYGEAAEAVAVNLDHLDDRHQTATSSTESHAAAIDNAKKSSVDYEAALQSVNDAMDERIAATNELVGGDIAVRDSQRAAAEAVRELTAAEAEGKLTVDEFAAAQDAAAQELIDAAAAAADYDETLLNASGQTLTAKESQDLFKAKLGEVAATLAPGSALRSQLQGYIDQLNIVPRDITTRLSTDTRGLRQYASGTASVPGPRGAPQLAVVHGGEEIRTASQVDSDRAKGNGNGNGATGGLTVNINGGLIDQQTIEQIAREWERWQRGMR